MQQNPEQQPQSETETIPPQQLNANPPETESDAPEAMIDLTQYDYKVKNSEWGKLELILTRLQQEAAEVILTAENITIHPIMDLSAQEEDELIFYLDQLLWEDPFSDYAHHSGIRVELEDPEELMEVIQENLGEDLLHIQFEQDEQQHDTQAFMGYLIRCRVEQSDDGILGHFHFTPIDQEEEVAEINLILDNECPGIVEAIAVKVRGREAQLDLAKHIEFSH